MMNTESYTLISHYFPRLIGLIYFFAFSAFLFQIKGLIGQNGILPLDEFFRIFRQRFPKKCYWYLPSVLWLNRSDSAIMALIIVGTALSVVLALGFFPSLMLIILYILYISVVSAGQDFLSFGWEGFLLEITANAFVISLTPIPNILAWLSINLLLFRFHFQAAMSKIQSRDNTWRDFTAISYHYFSQPLPNTIAWYMHKLPMWFHKLSVIFMFLIQGIFCFGIFLTEEIRLAVFAGFIALQFFIWATGNFSFLNHMTVAFCTILLNNASLAPLLGQPDINLASSPFWESLAFILGALLIFIQVVRIYHNLVPNRTFQRWLTWISAFHLANRYGIFAVMTTTRYEIVVEGSDDGINWKEYTFKYKPSELTQRPLRVSPYQPRIDWQAWFLPFSSFYAENWFRSFLYHLLKGTPEVVDLLQGNPFPTEPPKYVRALAYDYQFTSFEEKKESGAWWKRSYVGIYSPVVQLRGNP